MRGLSPGSQQIFTLTEAQRARYGLAIDQDVIRCVTSLRQMPSTLGKLDDDAFDRHFRHAGQRCWLLNVADEPSARLQAYLDSIDDDAQQATSTCRERQVWWRFKMPPVPDVLVATSFKGPIPKICSKSVGARAVGGVAGIYGLTVEKAQAFITAVTDLDIRDRIVAHANGLRKIEINQLNALLAEVR